MEWINKLIKRGLDRFNNYVDSISMEVLIGSISGLLLGILTGVLSSYPLSMIRGIGVYLTLLFYGFSVYMGLKVGSRRGVEFLRLMPGVSKRLDVKAPIKRLAPKVVDTSMQQISPGLIAREMLSKAITFSSPTRYTFRKLLICTA